MSCEFKIEKNIPIPNDNWRNGGYGRRRHSRFPIEHMEIGDSFLIPHGFRSEVSVRGQVSLVAGRLCMKVRVCKMKDGFRVWRIA